MDALQNGPFARPSLLKRAIGLVMATRTRGAAATTTPLERELEQARNGNHPRQVAEGKQLEHNLKIGAACAAGRPLSH